MERKSIGSFIAALRRANGLTQQELADRLNVSNKAVSRWERDETLPDLTLIPAIAELFGVSCDEILRGERRALYAESGDAEYTDDAETVARAEARAAQKSERRAAAIVERALSQFKALTVISAALIVVGVLVMLLIGMFIHNGSLSIGLVVMLIFDVAAAIMTIIAVIRLRSVCGGDIAGVCDKNTVTRYERTMVRCSYAVFAVLFVVLWVFVFTGFLSAELSPYVTGNKYESSANPTEDIAENIGDASAEVAPEPRPTETEVTYIYSILGELLVLTLCPAAVLYLLYTPYAALLTGKRPEHVGAECDRGVLILRIVCAVFGALSAMMSGMSMISLGCFLAVIAAAVIFVIKRKGRRMYVFVEGARCVSYTLAAINIVMSVEKGVRYHMWTSNDLLFGITILLVTAAVSRFLIKRISKKQLINYDK